MTTPTDQANEPEPMTLAEIRALLAQTAEVSAENARAIAEMSAGQERTEKAVAENARAIAEMRAANAERDARHDREMAELREQHRQSMQRLDRIEAVVAENTAAITRLEQAQNRTNQDVSTLKGWGLELYCERNPQIFANELGMIREELIPKREIRHIAYEAEMGGAITSDQYSNLSRADLFIYARRKSDNRPFCLVVEASYRVDNEDVNRASERANILDIILNRYQPRHLNGQVIAIVAGTDITPGAWSKLQHCNVTYVAVSNGNQLTNPPE